MISISELTKHSSNRKQQWTKIFNQILGKCHSRIKKSAKITSSCFYDVPVAVMGLPVYPLNECIKFIVKKLKDNGFEVHLRPPRTLLISWEHHQDDYVKPVRISNYIPDDYLPPVTTPAEPHMYFNSHNSSGGIIETPRERVFFDEDIHLMMPPPKLHYVKPKYPDTLTVSHRPIQTRRKKVIPTKDPPQPKKVSKESKKEIELKVPVQKSKKSGYKISFV